MALALRSTIVKSQARAKLAVRRRFMVWGPSLELAFYQKRHKDAMEKMGACHPCPTTDGAPGSEPALQLFALALFGLPAFVDPGGVPLAQLPGQFGAHSIQHGIKIFPPILHMNVRARHREVRLHAKTIRRFR